jgi:hypothetical protein
LRKYLLAAVAALAAVAITAVSTSAQAGDTFTLSTKLAPKDAGTKQNPKSSKLTLNVVNGNQRRTMSELDIYFPKAAKLGLTGLPSCTPAKINALQCPASTKFGKGEARALVGVNGTNPQPRIFDVTAYKTTSAATGKPMLTFFLDERGGNDLRFLPETTIKKASGKYGQRLNLKVPTLAQQVGQTYNGLVSLKINDLGKKKGKNALIATTGCKNKKHPFKTVLTFINNTVTDARKLTKTSTSKCTA